VEPTARCAAAELERFAREVLEARGAAPSDAAFAAAVIVASDLAGHESHGMRRLPEYVERERDGQLDFAARPVIELDRGAVVRLDGRDALGHVSLRDVTDLAIERARRHGVAVVALRNSSHAGRIADFCERAADAGAVIFFFVNDSGGGQDVAPPGGLAARLSTNPIGIGVPRRGRPHLVLDMATSVIAKGRVAEWRDRGEPLSAEWLTPGGEAIRSLGYKGFGLALVTEALAGVLTGSGSVTADPAVDDQGVLALAIDVAALRPLDDFAAELEGAIAYIRDVPLEPGAEPVRMPGEGGAASAAERARDGVPVQQFTWDRLAALAAELGLRPPQRQPDS
jgi:LDH2 family malate/lactate/ureidoglycolate dehydrogenase